MSRSKPKLPSEVLLPQARDEWERRLIRALGDYFRATSQLVNDLATGKRAALFNETSVVPTIGLFTPGDFVPVKDPVEAGTAGSKYIHHGWLCGSGGSASASSFMVVRVLTGN